MRLFPSLQHKHADSTNATARAISTGSAGTYSMYGSGSYSNNWDFEKAVSQGYEKLSIVFRCIDAISQNQADRELYVQEGTQNAGRRVPDVQVNYVLNRRSNIYETAKQFRYRLSSQLLLSRKGAFVERVNNKSNRVCELHLLDPSNVQPTQDPRTYVKDYRIRRADGGVDTLDPEQVIWIKLKPHPQDPYAQMTPLAAAGIVADTEYLSRIFNRSTVANNGKPGQLISVGGSLNAEDARELKSRFNGGPSAAGRTSVIEAKDVTVRDLSATPSELQYLAGLVSTKNDLLLAFGTPESVLGDASGRTFSNADAERLNWWMDTMQPHCNAIAIAFDVLTEGGLEDDLFITVNYNDVDVLQIAKRAEQDRLAGEVAKGLRTIDSYMTETGQKAFNQSATQVLWIPVAGSIPTGRDEQTTQDALSLASQVQIPGSGPAVSPDQVSASAQQGTQAALAASQSQTDNTNSARALSLAKSIAEKALQIVAEGKTIAVPYIDAEEPEVKEAPREIEAPVQAVLLSDDSVHPYQELRTAVESEMYGLLSAWTTRQHTELDHRLSGTKARKGTRHWEGEGVGTKALDTSYIASPEYWANNIADQFEPMLDDISAKQMTRTTKKLHTSGVIDQYNNEGFGNPEAGNMHMRLFGSQSAQDTARSNVVGSVKELVHDAAHRQSERVAERIAQLDKEGASVAEIKTEVEHLIGTRSPWQRSLATLATTAIVEGTVTKTLEPVGDLVQRRWNTHRDDGRIRPTHKAANGQTVTGSNSFAVGGAYLDYPGDPTGPIELIAQCRCHTSFVANHFRGR